MILFSGGMAEAGEALLKEIRRRDLTVGRCLDASPHRAKSESAPLTHWLNTGRGKSRFTWTHPFPLSRRGRRWKRSNNKIDTRFHLQEQQVCWCCVDVCHDADRCDSVKASPQNHHGSEVGFCSYLLLFIAPSIKPNSKKGCCA